MNQGISIVICCHNSSKRLPQTLSYILQQKVPSNIAWEVVLIDNASTDNTGVVAQEEWEKVQINVPFRIVKEPTPGLSAARKKGILEAKYEYLVFCDDDNWLDPVYLRIAYDTLESNPDIGITGGQSSGFFEIDKPEWFDNFSQSYVVEKPLIKSGYLPKTREYLAGAGMVIRKSIFVKLFDFQFSPMLTGRIGKSLMSGEDYELCLLTNYMGYKIYYNEDLKLVHFMSSNRLNWKYCLKMTSWGQAIPEIYFEMYRQIHASTFKGKTLPFNKIINSLIVNNLYILLVPENYSLKGFIKIPFRIKYFVKLFPGSINQVKYRSNLNQLVYSLKHYKKLKSEYITMTNIISKIHDLHLNQLS